MVYMIMCHTCDGDIQGGDIDDVMLDQFSKQLQMSEECADSRPVGHAQ